MKSNLVPRLKIAVPYIIVTAVLYLAIPFIMAAAKSPYYYGAPLLDCCVSLGVGYFYGRVAKRDPIMPLAAALLFLICMFTFFNSSAWIFIPLTALCSFIGQCFGSTYQGKYGRK